MAMGLPQPLREMSTRKLPGGKGQPACKATTLPSSVSCLKNLGAPTFQSPKGPHEMLQGKNYLLFVVSHTMCFLLQV
jgi:hypothetical protein